MAINPANPQKISNAKKHTKQITDQNLYHMMYCPIVNILIFKKINFSSTAPMIYYTITRQIWFDHNSEQVKNATISYFSTLSVIGIAT